MTFRLLELPEELVVAILEEVEDDAALRSLARACKHLQRLVEPTLYGSIFLRAAKQLRALEKSLRQHSRMDHVRSLEMRCKFGLVDDPLSPDDTTALSPLVRILLEARHLETFIFESPFCNNNRWTLAVAKKWKAMEDDLTRPFWEAVEHLRRGKYQKPPLQSLSTLELHLNGHDGKEFYDLRDSWFPIVLHPTLQSLKISSTNVGDDFQQSLRAAALDPETLPKTPLKQLWFDECNITIEGLHTILTIPAALECLALGEQNNWSDHDVRYARSLLDDPFAFMRALTLQKDSLERLFHIPSTYFVPLLRAPTLPLGFGEFTHLESIALEGPVSWLYDPLQNDALSPSELKTLAIQGVVLTDAHMHRYKEIRLRDILAANPSLEKLDLSFPSYYVRMRAGTLKTLLDQMASDCHAAKVELTAHRQDSISGIVAPLLYGEVMQVPTLVFNSRLGWQGPIDPADGDPDFEELDSDWFDEDEQGWMDEHGIEIDADDGDWEDETDLADEDVSDNDHVGENDDWWEATG